MPSSACVQFQRTPNISFWLGKPLSSLAAALLLTAQCALHFSQQAEINFGQLRAPRKIRATASVWDFAPVQHSLRPAVTLIDSVRSCLKSTTAYVWAYRSAVSEALTPSSSTTLEDASPANRSFAIRSSTTGSIRNCFNSILQRSHSRALRSG